MVRSNNQVTAKATITATSLAKARECAAESFAGFFGADHRFQVTLEDAHADFVAANGRVCTWRVDFEAETAS